MDKQNNKLNIPRHIAFIMDGNGRWAAAKKLPRSAGHKAGVKTVEELLKSAQKFGVKFITLYVFSTENWARPKLEVTLLMNLLKETLARLSSDKNEGVRIIVSGRREGLAQDVLEKIDEAVKSTAHNDGLTVNLALNYGARQEILDAVNKLLASGAKNADEKLFTASLYNDLPDPDLIIRTSGEKRLSNFLLWQAAYSEFYFTDALWPDFREKHLLAALQDFTARNRKYGAL